ncbi:MAG: sulfotransferase [Mycobacteriales bacterium]
MSERLDLERNVVDAIAATGLSDFGADTWRDGAERLVADLQGPAQLHDIGVEVALGDLQGYLQNRLRIVDHRKRHPEVEVPVQRPLVVVGQPRTGTTILFDLLAQDPGFRVPRSWEVDKPCPPPELSTYRTDPRIAEVQSQYDTVDALIPGFSAFHEVGAELAQECVRITGGDFRSMIFPVQYVVPAYNRWLLHDADLAPAYAWHQVFLQHLASRVPAEQWLLKSPAHLWHLPALRAAYPDAVVIHTHRDPLKVISSVSALACSLRRLTTDQPTVQQAAQQYADDIPLALDRAVQAHRQGVFPKEQVVDLHFTQFIADPIGQIRRLYSEIGRDFTPQVEQRMRDFLADHPGDGGGGGKRYSFADTGLVEGQVRERTQAYVEEFGVELEPLR